MRVMYWLTAELAWSTNAKYWATMHMNYDTNAFASVRVLLQEFERCK